MAKFFKNIFTSDKRKSRIEGLGEGEEDKSDFTPPMDGRRKLSISRSGRMKQAIKKRHSLTMELYGENVQQGKQKSMEYHVNSYSVDPAEQKTPSGNNSTSRSVQKKVQKGVSAEDVRTPDEEIESAFAIVDKVL